MRLQTRAAMLMLLSMFLMRTQGAGIDQGGGIETASGEQRWLSEWVDPCVIRSLRAQDIENMVVIVRSMDASKRRDLKDIEELWTDDAIKEYPFAPPQLASLIPARIEGKPAMMAYYRKLLAMRGSESRITVNSVLPLLEANTLLIEYRENTEIIDGEPLIATFAAIVKVRDGKISYWREFFDPSPILAAFEKRSQQ